MEMCRRREIHLQLAHSGSLPPSLTKLNSRGRLWRKRERQHGPIWKCPTGRLTARDSQLKRPSGSTNTTFLLQPLLCSDGPVGFAHSLVLICIQQTPFLAAILYFAHKAQEHLL